VFFPPSSGAVGTAYPLDDNETALVSVEKVVCVNEGKDADAELDVLDDRPQDVVPAVSVLLGGGPV
jgi:hypothetical protein